MKKCRKFSGWCGARRRRRALQGGGAVQRKEAPPCSARRHFCPEHVFQIYCARQSWELRRWQNPRMRGTIEVLGRERRHTNAIRSGSHRKPPIRKCCPGALRCRDCGGARSSQQSNKRMPERCPHAVFTETNFACFSKVS
jgi:hypothetical protein